MYLLFVSRQPSVAAHHSLGREIEVVNLLSAYDLLGILYVEGGEPPFTQFDKVRGIRGIVSTNDHREVSVLV
jgi:hypothetical protein